MTEKGLPLHGETTQGDFLDDDLANSVNSELCPSIAFKNVVNPGGKPDDFDWEKIHENPFYKLNVGKLDLDPIDEFLDGEYNFTPIDTINEIYRKVIAGIVKALFLDFDKTFQIYSGAMPFTRTVTLEQQFRIDGLSYKVIGV